MNLFKQFKVLDIYINIEKYSLMEIYNERMLNVMEFIVTNKINNVSSNTEFLNSINYPNENNIGKIRKGTQGFRQEHMLIVQKIYNVDMNFIFNKDFTEMFLKSGNVSAYHRLLEAVHMIGLEINK